MLVHIPVIKNAAPGVAPEHGGFSFLLFVS